MSSISTLLIITVVFFLVVGLPLCFSADQRYEKCLASPQRCGYGPSVFTNNITYPFWGVDIDKPIYCGRSPFKISCDDFLKTLTLEISNLTLSVVSTELDEKTITVADESFFEDGSCPKILEFNGDEQFTLNPNTEKIDLHTCSNMSTSVPKITCTGRDGYNTTYYFIPESVSDRGCHKVGEVPVLESVKKDLHDFNITLEGALKGGFAVRYIIDDQACQYCSNSTGVCGSDLKSGKFRCLCPDRPHKSSCKDDGLNLGLKIGIGIGAGVLGLTAASIAWFVYHRKKTKSYRTSSTLLPGNISTEPSSKSSEIEKAEDILVGVRLFSYEELEEATSNFDPSKELGDGGFGTVYYGKLKDGRSVAVKRLYDNNFKRAEQFRNEVEILTGLRHPNLVSLFGCSSKQSRDLLLVYEYVANGTLADHLHGPQANPSLLPWSIRLKIAVETASALKYLHASKIIHRDVKSNNILLDQNFNVKVADFGLSRLFPMDRTHVSTAPQGTPGYVDPDYHLCYQLSKKSDVYSFAVVLMELISSLPAVDITRTRQEINLSNMAVVKIQNHKLHEMVDPSLGFDTDTRVRETVTTVAELAFQCLQSDKDLRPCMSHVLETLTKIRNNGFGSNMDDYVDKSGPLVLQSPNSVMEKWDSK